MALTDKPRRWESTLDRELTKLGGKPFATTPPTPDRPRSTQDGPLDVVPGRSVSVSQLRTELLDATGTGMTLPDDIHDESGVLLLSAGSRLTERFLHLLRERGITQVRLRSPGPGKQPSQGEAETDVVSPRDLTTPTSRELDERLVGELQAPVVYHVVKTWRRPRLSIADLKGQAAQGVERHEATSVAVADVCATLKAGRVMQSGELRRSVVKFVDMAAVDFDLLPLVVAMQHTKDEYLYDHCVNVSLLSMAIASHLGLNRDRIAEIGLGGMLHDIGMLRVPDSIRLGQDALTEREWHEIHRHPLHTLDMLDDLRGLPQIVKFIAYQTHERGDGKGYPRGCMGDQLHAYAKIVAIADVYAAMTRARPHRRALTPYDATKTILMDGTLDKFDRTLVRAFLDTVALFPVGSQVSLSDGSEATVLRANPGMHTRPVVERVSSDGISTGQIIDLSRVDTIHVVKAMSIKQTP